MAVPDPDSDVEAFIEYATSDLEDWLLDRTLDLIEINPYEPELAQEVVDDISQLSSLVSVQIEAKALRYLRNEYDDILPAHLEWIRNDRESGEKYPDLALVDRRRERGADSVADIVWPGIEIKAWCPPLTTELGSRHKKSQTALQKNPSTLLLACWLPEQVAYGSPKIFETWWDDALSIAESRDRYWMQPAKSLIREPNDTSDRSASKQRSVTNRYLLEADEDEEAADKVAADLGLEENVYRPTAEFRSKVDAMRNQFDYSADAGNWRKLRRLHHPSLDQFLDDLQSVEYLGHTIGEWDTYANNGQPEEFERVLRGSTQDSLGGY